MEYAKDPLLFSHTAESEQAGTESIKVYMAVEEKEFYRNLAITGEVTDMFIRGLKYRKL